MDAVSGHLESVRDAVGLGFKRDAVGRVYVEDGMARMQPHVGIQALSGALHSATTGAMTQTQAALASTWSVSAGFVSSSAVQTLKIGEVIVATSEVIAGSGFRRDAIGRVVVEDGLRRMQPRGEGAHAEALRTARGAWSQTHEALAGTWNASALAAAGTWKASAVFVSSSATQSIRLGEGLGGAVGFGPRRDAIGRVVVEDGLARMQNRTPPATVALTALDDAKDALLDSYTGLTALSSDLLSRSSTAVASLTHASGDLVSSAGNVLVIEHCRRDAVGRIYIEDGLARMQVGGGRAVVSEAREHMSRLVSCGATAVGDMVTSSGRAFTDARESFGSSCRRLLQTLGSWLGLSRKPTRFVAEGVIFSTEAEVILCACSSERRVTWARGHACTGHLSRLAYASLP